jgi:tetratricopeptide (TPR) repeat protein
VFVTVKEPIGAPGHELVPRGLVFEALPKGQKPSAAEIESVWQSFSWHPGTFAREHRDYTADMILSDFHLARARRHLQEGRTAEALDDMQTAAAHGWGIKEVLNNIGGELAEAGLAAEAIPYLLAAWDVQPGYATARRNLAVAHERAGRHAEGLPWYRRQLEETPHDRKILRAAAQGARQVGARAEALGYYFRLAEVSRRDVETLKEVKAYLEGEGCAPELVACYDEQIRQAEEAEQRRREELVRQLEEEDEPGDEPPFPRAPVPQVPLVGADPLSELQRLGAVAPSPAF